MVPRRGLEPPLLSAHGPEPCASTNSAIWAIGCSTKPPMRRFVNRGLAWQLGCLTLCYRLVETEQHSQMACPRMDQRIPPPFFDPAEMREALADIWRDIGQNPAALRRGAAGPAEDAFADARNSAVKGWRPTVMAAAAPGRCRSSRTS